jgi:holliday junction DNA helicase RuvA
MIGFLKGKVKLIESDHIVVDVHDVGYEILTILPYEYKIDDEVVLYVYTHVREDQMLLFGFKELDIKKLFLKLIQVKGVGPKTALGILSSIDYATFSQAIEQGDINMLKKIPGIGPKSAGQIVLDLKGKLVVSEQSSNPDLQDALEALLALGYKKPEIHKVEKALANLSLSVEEYIKQGLQILLK